MKNLTIAARKLLTEALGDFLGVISRSDLVCLPDDLTGALKQGPDRLWVVTADDDTDCWPVLVSGDDAILGTLGAGDLRAWYGRRADSDPLGWYEVVD